MWKEGTRQSVIFNNRTRKKKQSFGHVSSVNLSPSVPVFSHIPGLAEQVMSLHTKSQKHLQWLNQLQDTMTVKICDYKFTISVVILHSCELSPGDDSTPKITMSFDLIKFLPHQWQIYRSNSYLVFIHLIETEQNHVTWRTTDAHNHQSDLVGQSVEGPLTRF